MEVDEAMASQSTQALKRGNFMKWKRKSREMQRKRWKRTGKGDDRARILTEAKTDDKGATVLGDNRLTVLLEAKTDNEGVGAGSEEKIPRNDDTRFDRNSDSIEINPKFERYYLDQKICSTIEWQAFVECLKKPIPISFRVNTSTPLWKLLLRRLLEIANESKSIQLQSCFSHIPSYLEKNCPSLYYKMDVDRTELRKNSELARFREFLIAQDTCGAICRMEAVSMLPVLYLDPRAGENVLDLCAAPGMKFIHLLDHIESRLAIEHGKSSYEHRGIVVGNDVCQSRISTLAHHVKAISSAAAVITNFDASRFPNLVDQRGEKILFDKILADVPCTCDGTLRKSLNQWRSWKPEEGVAIHRLQMAILKRAVQLLKPGGLLIYSTCSLNPLENEAISSFVASAEGKAMGLALEPLTTIQGFKCSPGLSNWLVPNSQGGYYSSYAESVPVAPRLTQSMFRCSEWEEERQKVIRILPHHNDSGGFYICAVRKGERASEIGERSEPSELAELVKPGEPSEPDELVEPNEPNEPNELVEPGELAGPNEPNKPQQSIKVDYQSSTNATNPTNTTNPPDPPLTNKNDEIDPSPESLDQPTVRLGKAAGQRSSAKLLHQFEPWTPDTTTCAFYGIDDTGKQLLANHCVSKLSNHSSVYLVTRSDIICAIQKRKGVCTSFTPNTPRSRLESCKFASVGVKIFTRFETKEMDCLRVSQQGASLMITIMKRRVMFVKEFGLKLLERSVNEDELRSEFVNVESCMEGGQLVPGGCIVVIVVEGSVEEVVEKWIEGRVDLGLVCPVACMVRGSVPMRLHCYAGAGVAKGVSGLLRANELSNPK